MKNGIWDQWTADEYHQSSPKLAQFLIDHLPRDQWVIDFGCGNGFYCHELEKAGFKAVGIEGFPLKNSLHKNVIIHDLTRKIEISQKGSVISLEVGEHIPPQYEQQFMNTLTSNCREHLIISWAEPDQPGIGHVNCLPQEYVINEIMKRGFSFQVSDTMVARSRIDKNCDWFERTLLVFKRKPS